MSPTDAGVVAARFYDRLAASDALGALALLGTGVSWHGVPGGPFTAEEPWSGSREVAEHVLGPMTQAVEDLALVIDHIHPLGSIAAAAGSYRGINRTTGAPFDVPFVHIWRLADNGEVVEVRVLTDAPAFTTAVAA